MGHQGRAEYDETEQNEGEYNFKEEWLATYPYLEAQPLQAEDWPSVLYNEKDRVSTDH